MIRTHPEAVIHEAVDDGVGEAVGHGEPVHRVVERDEDLLSVRRGIVGQLRMEVHHHDEDVKRQPTDAEQHHHHDQHLNHLKI